MSRRKLPIDTIHANNQRRLKVGEAEQIKFHNLRIPRNMKNFEIFRNAPV